VLIRVHAAGVNPVDTYISQGQFSGIPEDLPYIPGIDGSGIVEKVGAKVTKFSVGDRVFFTGDLQCGSYAEYTAKDEGRCWKLPQHLSFEQGACIGIPYFTAYKALISKVDCLRDQTILVHGASGGTGLATCQIAKVLALKVLGTAGSDEGARVVKERGMADQVFNHKQKNYAHKILVSSDFFNYTYTDNVGVDIIVEMAADMNLERDASLIKPGGTIADEWNTAGQYILQLLEGKKLNPVVDKVYPLEDAVKAHHDIMHNQGSKGKLVLKIV
uniref:Enoyl reductase (ER) domain-containing protein n=1 Tax=Romanomermis culicivorax TaxID=13658 RepID=A0A915IZ42_ROMCU